MEIFSDDLVKAVVATRSKGSGDSNSEPDIEPQRLQVNLEVKDIVSETMNVLLEISSIKTRAESSGKLTEDHYRIGDRLSAGQPTGLVASLVSEMLNALTGKNYLYIF